MADRALVANMAPEYGATMGFFPVDEQTLDYLRLTGRSDAEVALVERYTKEQQLFYAARRHGDPVYTKVLKLDLGTIEPSMAGPKRPQDRVPLANVKRAFQQSLQAPVKERGFGLGEQDLARTATVPARRNGRSRPAPSATAPWSSPPSQAARTRAIRT